MPFPINDIKNESSLVKRRSELKTTKGENLGFTRSDIKISLVLKGSKCVLLGRGWLITSTLLARQHCLGKKEGAEKKHDWHNAKGHEGFTVAHIGGY